MIKLAVIADDLTGCNDTGLQFARAGLRTTVVLDAVNRESFPDDVDVLVLDTDSRALGPESAYERVARVSRLLRDRGITRIYKKVDSTLRGNLGKEIEAAADVFDPDIVIIAPAFPQAGRTTVGGNHLLNGVPLTLTEFASDPSNPVSESRIIELLRGQTCNEITHVPLHVVMDGVSAIRRVLSEGLEDSRKWFVFDVAVPEHLRHIAEAASAYPKALWVGSAGLAGPLPEIFGWKSRPGAPAKTGFHHGPALIVAGSITAVTKAQTAHFLKHSKAGKVTLNPVSAVNSPDSEADAGTREALDQLRHGTDLLLTVESGPEAVRLAIESAKRLGLTPAEAGGRISETLGKIAAAVAIEGLCGILLTGGGTAASVCRALGAGGISILCEVAPAIALGIIADGPHAGMRIVTKSGAFGSEDVISKSVALIRGNHDQP